MSLLRFAPQMYLPNKYSLRSYNSALIIIEATVFHKYFTPALHGFSVNSVF